MKILYTFAAALLALSAIATAEIDCEIIPFNGRTDSFTTVYAENSHKVDYSKRKKWEIIKLPIGGFVGDIIVKDQAAVGGVARMALYEVRPEDFYEPRKDPPKTGWFGNMELYDPESRQHSLLYEHTWKIDKVPFKIPIKIPQSSANMSRCLFDVKDSSNKTIFTCTPAEVFQGQGSYYGSANTAWIFTDDEESDRRLKKYAGISTTERLTKLPGDWTHFTDVKAIWVDETTALDQSLMRRIILSGGWIFGDQNGLRPHLDKLGLPASSILMGGIHPLEKKQEINNDGDISEFSSHNYYSGGDRFKFSRYAYYDRDKSAPLEDMNHLFDEIKVPYMTFTFTVAILYAIGSAIILPFLFLRLNASRRVELWWRTPLTITVYTIVISLIGYIAVHPKAAISDATEYRLGYGDWPEVFCNINAASLKYGGKEYGWNFPAAAIRTYGDNKGSYLSIFEESDTSGKVIMNNAVRGMQHLGGFAYMKETGQPFSAAVRDNKIQVTTTRDVRNLCVQMGNGHWQELGALKAGESVSISEPLDTKSILFPDAISRSVSLGKKHRINLSAERQEDKVCKNCDKAHTVSGEALILHDGCILLAALDEKDQPAITGVQKNQRHKGRVAWICQVPVVGYRTYKRPTE